MSLLEVKCPGCKGTLWVDPATGKVIEHKPSEHQKANFEEFLNARKKGVAWDDKFKKAKEEDAKRKAEIELKFKQAKETPVISEDNDSPMKTPLDWD
jgi:hypothetical protein